jgi:2-polyprenyl-3-methyl-5-hydroxy-6-metoxy-1,4-benzoquinol methylase
MKYNNQQISEKEKSFALDILEDLNGKLWYEISESVINWIRELNSTPKYMNELYLLRDLIGNSKRVLDYGCGTGFAVGYFHSFGLKVSGYDKNQHDKDFDYCDPFGVFDTVYFMHSIAHIENPLKVLRSLKCKRLIIITPNADWLNLQNNENYTTDDTVVSHFNQHLLTELVKDAGFKISFSGQFGAFEKGQNERLFIKAVK